MISAPTMFIPKFVGAAICRPPKTTQNKIIAQTAQKTAGASPRPTVMVWVCAIGFVFNIPRCFRG